MRTADGLFEVLQEKGWGIRQFSRLSGISHTTLVQLRAGKVRPSARTMDICEEVLQQYHRDYLFPRRPTPSVLERAS